MDQLYLLNATQILELLKNGTLTVEEYAQSLLGRIKERDSIVKAWAFLGDLFVTITGLLASRSADVLSDHELILRQARALDEIPHDERGQLHGLAIGVKDIMNTRDMPTQFGSPIYRGHQPCLDSSAVAILRDAGALIFGKTTTTEFTVTNSGPSTTNPHDPNRTPGGSSCGSAATVADFQVPLSLGAQTGGSVIRPASYTGVFAMKPTYNAIPLEGQKTDAATFDTFGFFARTSDDLQLLADVFDLKDDELPSDVPLDQISVALVETPMWSQAGPSTESAIKQALSILKSKGVKIEEVSFPANFSDAETVKRVQKIITNTEAKISFLREYRENKMGLLALEIQHVVENKDNFTHKDATEASDLYDEVRHAMNKLAQYYSVILTPSAVDEAPLGLEDMGSATFNTPWTGFHMPVVNVPASIGAHGLPVGVSLVAPRHRDQHLLKITEILGDVLIAGGGWKVG